jgi:transposase
LHGDLTPDLGHAESRPGLEEARRSDGGEEDVLRGVPPGRGGAVPDDAGATVVGIAGDLGIMDGTLSAWLKAVGVEVHRWPGGRSGPPPDGETPEQELARLRSRVAELEADARKLNSERDILRAAAKYFAGETRW